MQQAVTGLHPFLQFANISYSMHLELVHTIEYILKSLGWSRSLLSLQSKSCLMIILVFYEMRRAIILPEKQK